MLYFSNYNNFKSNDSINKDNKKEIKCVSFSTGKVNYDCFWDPRIDKSKSVKKSAKK